MTPGATYRLQLHPGFTFDDAAAVVPYLARLGVSHVYLSPSLQAAPGSTHGYDVVDPTRLNEELGGDAGLERLRAAATDAGLGLVLDIVPNHVGLVPTANAWWWDVLEHGRDSAYAGHFDIGWDAHGDGRLVIPELGAPLDEELAGGDLRLVAEDGGLRVAYHEHRWPVRPGTTQDVGLPADPQAASEKVAGDPELLREVLAAQHYRLVHWRRGNSELNYRRFFDITTLGGVRIEDPDVFRDTHQRVLDLVHRGAIDGLRVDHPDGLWDPTGYAGRLREAAPGAWIVFEKILEHGERRRRDWPVDGTVGYEFADLVLGQFVDDASEPVLTDLYDRLLEGPQDYATIVDEAKREVVRDLFPAELQRLTNVLTGAGAELGREVARDTLAEALAEVVADHPVYRTYVRPAEDEVAATDVRLIASTIARARVHLRDADAALDLIEDLLTLRERSPAGDEFVYRFQQLTGPVMAKGVEDTTFYRYLRFAAVNEVGGDPSRLGRGLGDLHEANTLRQRDWPATLLSTSTHDTKRSEDVRARLAVCSQLPEAWVGAVEAFRSLSERHRGTSGPSANHEYLAFQTLVGAWPIDADRLVEYLRKAAREEKRSTSWLDQDETYEADLEAYARSLLADDEVVGHLEAFVGQIVRSGRVASLAQTLLKLTSPGVPDTYQGTEVWDLSLVDPDNRRPVDFDRLARLLDAVEDRGAGADGPDPERILGAMDEGLPKLWVTHRTLRLRRELPEAFGPDASYAPLWGEGQRLDDVVAFVRGGAVLPVVPRRTAAPGGAPRADAWGDTTLNLPDGSWYDVLSGQRHEGGHTSVGVLLDRFPVALLTRAEETS